MKKVIVIDNYDSFTYNLVHYIEGLLGQSITVKRNDQVKMEELNDFDYIVLSPGPGLPSDAGMLEEIIRSYFSSKKILGVCLGMQAITEAFGGKLINLDTPFHGVSSEIFIDTKDKLYKNIPKHFLVGRYHSWAIAPDQLPKNFLITSTTSDGTIMSFTHESLPVYGVQYHPESILTEHGKQIIANFLDV